MKFWDMTRNARFSAIHTCLCRKRGLGTGKTVRGQRTYIDDIYGLSARVAVKLETWRRMGLKQHHWPIEDCPWPFDATGKPDLDVLRLVLDEYCNGRCGRSRASKERPVITTFSALGVLEKALFASAFGRVPDADAILALRSPDPFECGAERRKFYDALVDAQMGGNDIIPAFSPAFFKLFPWALAMDGAEDLACCLAAVKSDRRTLPLARVSDPALEKAAMRWQRRADAPKKPKKAAPAPKKEVVKPVIESAAKVSAEEARYIGIVSRSWLALQSVPQTPAVCRAAYKKWGELVLPLIADPAMIGL